MANNKKAQRRALSLAFLCIKVGGLLLQAHDLRARTDWAQIPKHQDSLGEQLIADVP